MEVSERNIDFYLNATLKTTSEESMFFYLNNFCLGGSFVKDVLEIILWHQDVGVKGC